MDAELQSVKANTVTWPVMALVQILQAVKPQNPFIAIRVVAIVTTLNNHPCIYINVKYTMLSDAVFNFDELSASVLLKSPVSNFYS